jgi:hypothetical protein
MKKICLALFLPVVFLCPGNIATAQSTSNSTAVPVTAAPALNPEEKEQASYEKRTKSVMDALKLDDTARAARVHDILVGQFAAWKAWHAQNDAQLKELWNQYGKARTTKNQTNIDNAMAQIDTVYASFKPQHDEFKSRLAAVLTPEQIEAIEDSLTINKVKITFNAYGEIFHGLTDEQKAFILKKLKAARTEAIDAGAMTEKSAFFKKYKDQIEAYLTAQGYDVKQCYKDFVAKQKAEAAAKQAAAQTDTKPAKDDKK